MELELVDFLKRTEGRTTLSQIILPFCSDATGDRPPVAFLTGNINVKTSLKRNGRAVVFEEELKRLETEIAQLKVSKETKELGQVIDLSSEMKRLQIQGEEVQEKEIEIKEEWTEADEIMIRERRERKSIIIEKLETVSSSIDNSNNKLADDIEELLKMAELEEEMGLLDQNETSKIKEIKREVKEEILKPKSNPIVKLNLPKITSSNPLLGDIIERSPEPIMDSSNNSKEPASLKKSSRFSLRKQQNEQ